jgi:DNA-binding CsgD family transcriptional regulator
MARSEDTRGTLDAREAGKVEAATLALSRLPVRAPLADVFAAIRPCVPLAAGFFGIVRPDAPDAMVICPFEMPSALYDGWLGTPRDQMAQTLAPVVRSDHGGLWRDSETVTGALREQLDVLRMRDTAGFGEGAGYKILERTNPWHGKEHFVLAILMGRGSPILPSYGAMLAAMNEAISEAVLRLGLPFSERDSVRAQIAAERSTGYICVSRSGAVIEANRRAHHLVMRYRHAVNVEEGRSAVADFAAWAQKHASRGQGLLLRASEPAFVLDVSATFLPRAMHAFHEDVLLVSMNELRLAPSSVDDIMKRARLTQRERQIALHLIRTSASHKQIADELGRSERTVDTHITRIYAKLGVGSRAALMQRLKE